MIKLTSNQLICRPDMTDTASVPLIFHQTGATRSTSWEEKVLLRRTKKILHDWQYSYWTDLDLFTLFASELPQWSEKFQQITRGVVKADIGRYAVMYCRGGIYVDTDYKFIKYPSDLLVNPCTIPTEDGMPIDPADSKETTRFRLGNACLSSVKRHPFWLGLIDFIFSTRTIPELNDGDPIDTTGPAALTEFWLQDPKWIAGVNTLPMVKFYPDLTWSRLGIARSPETVGIHMCWGTWRTRRLVHNIKTISRRKVSCMI